MRAATLPNDGHQMFEDLSIVEFQMISIGRLRKPIVLLLENFNQSLMRHKGNKTRRKSGNDLPTPPSRLLIGEGSGRTIGIEFTV